MTGKSAVPHVLKGYKDFKKLPCWYTSSKKGWMTADLLDTIVQDLNLDMKKQKRKVVLLMDNAGCHLPIAENVYSNVTIKFLPPNMTCHIQPLDAGIINCLKVFYRKFVVEVCTLPLASK